MITNDYLAGLFDGEGWFSIKRSRGGRVRSTRPWQHGAMTGLTMREEWIVREFQNRFGGTVNLQRNLSDQHSPYYHWHASGYATRKFIEEIGPLLQLKRKQAEVVKQFLLEKELQGNRPVSDERYQKYEKAFDTMKILNQKGVGK